MDDKIKSLFQSVYQMSFRYLIEQKRDIVVQVKEIIPQIQEFVLWFLEGNRFGIEDELYQEMQNYVLQVLSDIMDAITQNDRVLLHDAIAYGLMEFLRIFIDSAQEEIEDGHI